MISSRQPRKQRRAVFNAPMHLRRKLLRSHLSKDLRKQLKKRAAVVCKGDKVRVTAGEFKGASGAITRVDYKRAVVFVEGIVARKQGGREKPVALKASKLVVTEQSPKKKLI